MGHKGGSSMKKLFLMKLVSLMLVGTAWGQLGKVSQLATAIARTEGFYVKGTIPNRLHNPGDIRAKSKTAYAGQVGLSKRGYVIFKNDAWGWSALEKQIERVMDGTSGVYNPDMTFRQIAKHYATDPRWVQNVCKILKVSPRTTFSEFFDLAPIVKIPYDGVLCLR
jgi:hypothetical protein